MYFEGEGLFDISKLEILADGAVKKEFLDSKVNITVTAQNGEERVITIYTEKKG